MKRVFLLLIAVVFSTSMYAQDEAALSAVADKEAVAEVATAQNPELENQIKGALKSDETLQKETINYLKENPETASSVAEIIAANGDSLDGIISAVLGDSELSKTAVSFIKDNPELLNKAMELAGM
jgi:hypothetical protein